MSDLHLLNDIALALGLAFAGGFAARLLGASPIIGYLLAGVAIGPFTPGYTADPAAITEVAEIGIVFLMFGVGLHFNLRDLASVRGIAVPGALLQMAAAAALGLSVMSLLDYGWREGLIVGLAISISSTVVLIRALEERGVLRSIHGQVAVGWLIVQDLATILMLVVLPVLRPSADSALAELFLSILKAALFVGVILALGSRVLPWLLSLVARSGSRELFVLAVVGAALGIATGASLAGISVALGAFIAGVAISEAETSHQAAADVLPLRDAFAVLFFVSVGMLLDPDLLRDNAGLALALLAVVVGGKFVIGFAAAALFPYPARTAFTVAAGLAQIGEFSFILAQEGLDLDLLSPAAYNAILAASVLSIALNPLAFRAAEALEAAARGRARLWRRLDHQGPAPTLRTPADGHVVIAGHGRVGALAARALQQAGVPYVVVEAAIGHARELNDQGIAAVWGDAASLEVLRSAGVERATAFVVAVPDEPTAYLAITNARALNPQLKVIVRARHQEEVEALAPLRAAVVVPEYEGGAEVVRLLLVTLGRDPIDALAVATALRRGEYEH